MGPQKEATLNESGWGTKALPVCPGPSCWPANNKEGEVKGDAHSQRCCQPAWSAQTRGLIFFFYPNVRNKVSSDAGMKENERKEASRPWR